MIQIKVAHHAGNEWVAKQGQSDEDSDELFGGQLSLANLSVFGCFLPVENPDRIVKLA